ncbi:MAG: hypothetical protein ACJAT7_002583, partial [Psychromonas sp.]|uniref:hypothetical protein n=1 Tax=Psychromonas sp. TaxID=1884585 RepID=UPI0039E5A7AC
MSKYNPFDELLNSSAFKVMRQIENSPHMKILDQINNDPVIKMMDELENPPYMKVMDEINNDPISKVMAEIDNSPYMKMLEKINNDSILSMTSDFENILPKSILQGLESPLVNALKELNYFSENSACNAAFSLAEKLSTFDSSFIYGKNYADLIRSFEDQDWESVIDECQLQINESPNNNLSLEFYLGLLLTLMILCYTEYSGSQSEQRLTNKIDNLEAMVVVLTDSLKDLPLDSFFLVKVPLNIRVSPSITSRIIETLPPKLKLSGLQTEGEWMQVEYFDYFSNKMMRGW